MPVVRSPDNEQHVDRIQQALTQLLDVYTLSPDGNGILMDRPVEQDVYRFVLKLETEELFPKDAEPQALRHLERATISLKKRPPEEQTAGNLLNTLNTYLDHRGTTPIEVLVFLNLRSEPAPESITLACCTVEKAPADAYMEFLQNAKLRDFLHDIDQNVEATLSQLVPYQYTVDVPTHKFANGLTYALEDLTRPIEQVRALINFADSVIRYPTFELRTYP